MGILDQCEQFFGSRDIYTVFQISKNADDKNVKKAYHKLSLKVHPDRVADDEKEAATEKFKVLAKIYEVLTDENRRKVYDEHGIVDDSEANILSWLDLWNTIFKPVTVDDIDSYKKEYIGSDIEKKDIKQAYINYKGCINKMSLYVPFMDVENEPRIIDIVKEMIAANEVPEYKLFTEEPASKRIKRHKKSAKEEKEAKKIKEKRQKEEGELSLEQQIMKRQNERSAGLASLFAKYGSANEDEEEAFELKSLKAKKNKNKTHSKKRINKDGKSKERKVRNGRVSKQH